MIVSEDGDDSVGGKISSRFSNTCDISGEILWEDETNYESGPAFGAAVEVTRAQ